MKHQNKGFIIICGPSGVGKSTLLGKIISSMGGQLTRIVSYTTRKRRKEEEEGKDYFFISEEEFFEREKKQEFIEWAQIYDHYSATSKKQVQKVWSQDKVIIKDVDINGLKSIKKIYPHSLTVSVLVSQSDEIKKRIQKRGSDEGQSLQLRLSNYQALMKELKPLCSVHIYNDDLDLAEEKLKKEIEKYLNSL